MKRRKIKKLRKEVRVFVRVTDEQKALFVRTATLRNMDLSDWLRQAAQREADKYAEKFVLPEQDAGAPNAAGEFWLPEFDDDFSSTKQ